MMQKKMMDEELERRGSQQAADQTALMAAIGGTPEWQNPDFDPAATGGAQPITSIIPGQDGQVLGMGANPQQQTLIDAVAGGTPQAALSAMGTQGISPEMVRNLGSMGMQAQMAERQTQAARQAALDAESADRRRFIFEQGLKTDDKRELARFEANLENTTPDLKNVRQVTIDGQNVMAGTKGDQLVIAGKDGGFVPVGDMFGDDGIQEIRNQQALSRDTSVTEDLADRQLSVDRATRIANKLLGMPDDAFKAGGTAARIAGSVIEDVQSIASLAGYEEGESYSTLTDANRYADEFKGLGTMNAVAKANMLDLALAYAAQSGLGTNRSLSDKDVARALQRFGGDMPATADARRALIRDGVTEMQTSYERRHNLVTGEQYGGGWESSGFTVGGTVKDGENSYQITRLTPQGKPVVMVNGVEMVFE